LERYELVRLLGKGATGDVHLARDRLLDHREVALKRLHVAFDDALRDALEREFATVASLAVPGVARVFDYGVLPAHGGEPERPFFTRSYVAGLPLDVASERANAQERLGMFVRVAEVIAPLHRVGVVHGDIKPGNAVIDTQGAAHVIDFGLARVVGRDARVGPPAGTLPFMAPELLRGAPPTPRSDIYALGATLWLLLTGAYPRGREGRPGGARETAPDVPAGTEGMTARALGLAQRALAPDPLDRFPAVDEFIAGLQDLAPSTRVARQAPFVAPRPRGHADALGRLQALALGAGEGGSAAVLVPASRGAGKSLLLEELKWRLQIRSLPVVQVAVRGTDVDSAVRSLLRQVWIGAPEDATTDAVRRAYTAVGSGEPEPAAISDAVAGALPGLGGRGPAVVLVDDLDMAGERFGAILRALVFAESSRPVVVVATAANEEAAAVGALAAPERVPLPSLSEADARALASEALGPVDASVLDALVRHAQGLPAALIDALATLSRTATVVASDVQRLPPFGASVALARSRLAAAPEVANRLVTAVALVARALPADALAAVWRSAGQNADALADALAAAERAGLLVARAEGLAIADPAVEAVSLEALGDEGVCRMAGTMLTGVDAAFLSATDRARLALRTRDPAQVCAHVPDAAAALAGAGAHAGAAELYAAWLPFASESRRRDGMLALARSRHALGEYGRAAEIAQSLLGEVGLTPSLRAETALVAARALVALGRLDDAIAALGNVPADAAPPIRARSYGELAKIHLRRGDYPASFEAACDGLAQAPGDDVIRVELLCSMGMAESYRSRHDEARAHHEEALVLARRLGAKREEANALAYLAIGHWRTGDALSARDLLSQCLELAREARDIGSMATFSMNLGAILFYLGEPQQAAELYTSAGRLARRAGRASTDAQARNNLAHVQIYFGLYERARIEVNAVLREASAAGNRYVEAQAIALLGDLAARTGDPVGALKHYDDALARYGMLGQTREIADHHLDAAEVLLDRGEADDARVASERIAAARGPIEREGIGDLGPRLALLAARARLAHGEAEEALPALESLVDEARQRGNREAHWGALAAAARAHERLGSSFAASRCDRLAVEALEDIALRVPREHRDAFWQDPRRRAVRARAARQDSGLSRSLPRGPSTLMTDPRAERLFEIIKRLAGEHDLERLLERITESAVDLSGAERGYVLLVDERGHLAPRTMRASRSQTADPHEAFSRSIAEAVLIDGEAIVAVNAADDGRLNEYLSVHRLMLRSVACLPIRGPERSVGVLYLEHRRAAGRFSESTVDLLHAFADQAAIALENARLIAENRRRQEELQSANDALERAKHDLEALLAARTDELADAERELARTAASRRGATRHGMVARGAAMMRVFDGIERLRGTSVPVVVSGEAGTGKELVARAIHQNGPRAGGPFVALGCGTLPEALIESELFGHVKGAFSGAERDRVGMIARASGGTLFLDEVGEMPAKMQVDLLRVLQEGTVCKLGGEVEERVDVRFIAATNVSLAGLVREGRFRADLYYRLNVVEIAVPPLRDRRDDIAPLCEHFLRAFAKEEGKAEKRLSRAALDLLVAAPWPGNVRQLQHVLLQASVLCDASVLDADDLALPSPGVDASPAAAHDGTDAPATGESGSESVEAFRGDERRRILAALESHGWNRARAARALGIPRRTFYRRLADYGILGA
jgi:transcriptional regulator with GAF, ATPase, and Fis domain